MNKTEKKHHIVDILFILALFCVFAVSALMLSVLGSNVYQKTVESMSENHSSRTAIAYITEKVRQNDVFDSVSITTLQGVDALALSQTVEDIPYCTYLYLHDGCLKELFVRTDIQVSSDLLTAGTEILEAEDFSLEQVTPSLLRFSLTPKDCSSATIYIYLHS